MGPMNWQKLADYLLPKEEDRDPVFREELDRLSVVGLRVIAGVCIGAPLFMVTIGLAWAADMWNFFRLEGALGILVLGLITLALSSWRRARSHARRLGMLNGFFVFIVQVWAQARTAESVFVIPGNITMIMLVGIASLPLKPLHVVGLGLSMLASHMALAPWLSYSAEFSARLPVLPVVVAQILLICTVLTAVVYHQRVAAYRARRAAQESFDELREAQSRLLVTENAASQGRLAAALSHELNSPIGALSSALDTLLAAYEKIETQQEEMGRLKDVILGATRSARQSSRRLIETVGRMKHLTNLDRADEQVVDLNALWRSTVALLQAELEPRAEIELDLKPIPSMRCRPQQMSAVFSNLLRNSAASMERRGRIRVVSERRGGDVVLEVRDDGRGIPRDQLPYLFDPSFRVEGSRVATTNWGLFISRSIIVDHGGRIDIVSEEGRGTTVRMSLPIGWVAPAAQGG